MILMQQGVKDRPGFEGCLTQLLDLQRLRSAQRASDRIGRVLEEAGFACAASGWANGTEARRQRHHPVPPA